MEELDFFEEICLISLYATKAVKFAAVVNSNGKMVTGKFRRIHGREGSMKMANSPKFVETAFSFYRDNLIPALNNMAIHCWLDWTSNEAHFEIIANQEKDNNSKMVLAVTPITQTRDKFLCIYLQMTSKSSNQHQQIMSKLCDAIQ